MSPSSCPCRTDPAAKKARRHAPILWPEHFDLAITIDGVNYGASPGDQHVAQPYLYVGPHVGPPTRGDFWNAEFGAVRTIDDVASPDDALSFFRQGRSRLGGTAPKS